MTSFLSMLLMIDPVGIGGSFFGRISIACAGVIPEALHPFESEQRTADER